MYADDSQLFAAVQELMQILLLATEEWCIATRQSMNAKKFACLSTVPSVTLTYQGESLELQDSARSLGVTISAVGDDPFVELDK